MNKLFGFKAWCQGFKGNKTTRCANTAFCHKHLKPHLCFKLEHFVNATAELLYTIQVADNGSIQCYKRRRLEAQLHAPNVPNLTTTFYYQQMIITIGGLELI